MDRRELKELSKIRQKEAQALLRLRLWDGAYYLAGYAVECAIKACIAKETRRYEFPDKRRANDSYTHNLRELIRVAKLEGSRRKRESEDPEFRKNWGIVVEWSEESRYASKHLAEDARRLVEAITDKHHGVVPWIELHW